MIRVRIEYFDQNEGFAQLLPKEGALLQRLSSDTGADDWHLVELDKEISYQLKVGKHFQFKLIETKWLLIRSRWKDGYVGKAEPTSVFLLLVEPSQLPLKTPLHIEDYCHVAWGMCHTIHSDAQQGVAADRPRPAGSAGG